MSGRIVNRTTPGLRRPTWDQHLDRLIDQVHNLIDPFFDALVPGYSVSRKAADDMVSGYRFTEKALDTARQALRADPKIIDYPGPGALDHYAQGGVIRVQRPLSGPDARIADNPKPLAWSETKAPFVPSSECYWL